MSLADVLGGMAGDEVRASHACRFSCGYASRLCDRLVRGTRPHSEFVDLGRASRIGALCCFRCTRLKELALVACYRNRRPWIRQGFLALQKLGLYPALVRSCLHARGLSARCLCGRACPRLQRGVAHSEEELRRSQAHHSSVFIPAYRELQNGLSASPKLRLPVGRPQLTFCSSLAND